MNIDFILKKIVNLLGNTASIYLDLRLDQKPEYQDIVNLWYYHITTNKIYRSKYIRPEYNKEMLKQIVNYRKYYSQSVRSIFESHTILDLDNILLFLIKDQEKFLVFLKSNSIGNQPFLKIYLSTNCISNINSKLLDIEENTIRLLFYKESTE